MTRCITGFIVVSPDHCEPGTTMMVSLSSISIINQDRAENVGCSLVTDGKLIDVRESMEQVIALVRQAQADLRNDGLISVPSPRNRITMVGRMLAFQKLSKRGEILLSIWKAGIRTVNEAVERSLMIACRTNETVKDVVGVIVEDGDNAGDLNFFHLILDLGDRCDRLELSSQVSPEAPLDVLIPEMLGLIEAYKAEAVQH